MFLDKILKTISMELSQTGVVEDVMKCFDCGIETDDFVLERRSTGGGGTHGFQQPGYEDVPICNVRMGCHQRKEVYLNSCKARTLELLIAGQEEKLMSYKRELSKCS